MQMQMCLVRHAVWHRRRWLPGGGSRAGGRRTAAGSPPPGPAAARLAADVALILMPPCMLLCRASLMRYTGRVEMTGASGARRARRPVQLRQPPPRVRRRGRRAEACGRRQPRLGLHPVATVSKAATESYRKPGVKRLSGAAKWQSDLSRAAPRGRRARPPSPPAPSPSPPARPGPPRRGH